MKLALKLDSLTKEINVAIRGGLENFIKAGDKLKQIRDGNLFYPEYESFSLYCDAEIMWGKSHSYSAILTYEKCGHILIENPDLKAAGQTRVVLLLPFMQNDEVTKDLLHMAAHTPSKGFSDNLRNLKGKTAQHDECEHDFALVQFEQCSKCNLRKKIEAQK